MGIKLFKISESKADRVNRPQVVIHTVEKVIERAAPAKDINPDPLNYQIIDYQQIGVFLIVKINYPDCTNYEGDKILVFKGVSLSKLESQKFIDPHFSTNKRFAHPCARFEPTKWGWNAAIKFAKTLS